jgi:two-component system chemotaxis response regulator CheB
VTRVLVVDDSALVRQLLSGLLGGAGMDVQAVADPLFARERMKRFVPDVIVLDLEMPRMDGLTFLRLLRAEGGPPVVVCSGVAGDRTAMAMRALAEGATDVIARPRIGVRAYLEESVVLLTDAIKAAAATRRRRRARATIPRAAPAPALAKPRRLIAIGASTGGTEAIDTVLASLPRDCPPVAIVQHMPAGFTAALASRLDGLYGIRVKEAAEGDAFERGRVLIAPGGRHLRVRRQGGALLASIGDGPLVSRHRPSVDVLFQSVAEACGASAVGVLLTGMGEDGAHGMRLLHDAGAATIAQDEATSVVFGMPKAAIDAGGVEEVVPLGRVGAAISERCRGR